MVSWFNTVDEDLVFISVASLGEIRRGIELMSAGRRRNDLAFWLENDLPERFEGRIIDIDDRIAERWGAITARAEKAGRRVGSMDAFFAATAAVRELTFATRNLRHFEHLGVALFNPWKPRAEA